MLSGQRQRSTFLNVNLTARYCAARVYGSKLCMAQRLFFATTNVKADCQVDLLLWSSLRLISVCKRLTLLLSMKNMNPVAQGGYNRYFRSQAFEE